MKRVLATIFTIILFVSCGNGERTSLRIGLMPAVNSIPLLIAESEGYFEEAGLDVELIMFRSQQYRETALQTNDIDGTISDLINLISAVNNGFGVKAVCSTEGRFHLLTSRQSEIEDIQDWQNAAPVRTGLLENSIVNLVTDQMLEAEDISPDTVNLISTLHLPSRIEMLLTGELEAACVPEPMNVYAQANGAGSFLSTDVLQATPGILLFTERSLEAKAEGITRLLEAYNRAAEAVNRDPDSFRRTIVTGGGFPEEVEAEMTIPTFRSARLPSRELVNYVNRWMMDQGLIESPVGYSQLIAEEVLP
ncbi:MAG: ABC transporter substrate-binding protein [Spirochaetia bacterium]